MARWHSCNVLHVGPDHRRVWHFDARGAEFAVNREQTVRDGESLPYTLVTKTWRSLWQPKLNVAWLPAHSVFLRVAHLPRSNFEETRSMVELQLEKLSPIPVTQVVWSMQVLPQLKGDLQTVVVTLAERKAVEDFLGQLEGQGYLPDRLEVPVLDQLQATAVTEDGAWIYPGSGDGRNAALVAWWYDGALQNLNLVTLPEVGDRAAALKAQLSQIVWSGELEGWLTAPPVWHLVADEKLAAEWGNALQLALSEQIKVSPPLPPVELAARTAKRAAVADTKVNLLPEEFLTRYKLQFQDRLWMRGLGALVAIYLAGVVVYALVLGGLFVRTHSVESKVAKISNDYTNATQVIARYDVLKDRQDLKFAALDCWKAVADTLPGELTLDNFTFSEGHKLTLRGNAGPGMNNEALSFFEQLRKAKKDEQALFDLAKSDASPGFGSLPGGGVSWSFTLELKRVESL